MSLVRSPTALVLASSVSSDWCCSDVSDFFSVSIADAAVRWTLSDQRASA
jgi:hypothetical protein